MIIGIPKEIKTNENRVSLLPVGAELLRGRGHTVLVETNAGEGSGFLDKEYIDAGAEIVATASEVYKKADMIIKVKEPLKAEYDLHIFPFCSFRKTDKSNCRFKMCCHCL